MSGPQSNGPRGGGPLAGVKVLDLTRFINGPSATRKLADNGAIVIKVENPKTGDELRGLLQGMDGYNSAVQYMNRGKKSISLDYTKPEARPVMERLIKWADVVCENMKAGTLDKYWSYEDMKAINPGIILATNNGFGRAGPMGSWGSFDGVAQAFTGVMHAQGGGADKAPQPVDFAFSDEVGAMSFAMGILMALVHKGKTGEGQRMDTSQTGATLEFMGTMLSQVSHLDGKQPVNPAPGYAAPKFLANQYKCSDGKFIHIQTTGFIRLFNVIGRQDMAKKITTEIKANPQKMPMMIVAMNNDYVTSELAKTLATRPRHEWLELIDGANAGPVGPVYSFKEVLEHEQVWANGYLVRMPEDKEHVPGEKPGGHVVMGKTYKFSASPAGPVERGPEVGEHNDEVLQGTLGFSQAEMDNFQKAGIVIAQKVPHPPPSPLTVDGIEGMGGVPPKIADALMAEKSKL